MTSGGIVYGSKQVSVRGRSIVVGFHHTSEPGNGGLWLAPSDFGVDVDFAPPAFPYLTTYHLPLATMHILEDRRPPWAPSLTQEQKRGIAGSVIRHGATKAESVMRAAWPNIKEVASPLDSRG